MNYLLHTLILLAAAEMTTAGRLKVKCKEERIMAKAGEDDVIQCRLYSKNKAGSVAFVWKKEDAAEIIYNYTASHGSRGQNPSYRDRAQVFDNEIRKGNVSLRLRNVTLSDSGTYSLSVASRSQRTQTQVFLSIRASFHSSPGESRKSSCVGLGSWLETLCYYLWSYVRALTQCATLLPPYSSMLFKSRRDLERSTFNWKYCCSHLDKLSARRPSFIHLPMTWA